MSFKIKIIVIILWIIIGIVFWNNIYINNKMEDLMANGRSNLTTGPIQEKLKDGEEIILKGVRISKLAKYDITGKVLGKEYYYLGRRENKISPEDLILCWGPASENVEDISIQYSSNDRFAYYKISGNLYEEYGDDANHYISNNHIIPINSTIKKILKKVKKGDIVQLMGYLVSCEGKNWKWGPSSLSRTDTGNGACEIFLVEGITIQ